MKTKNFDEFINENEITKVQGAQVQSQEQPVQAVKPAQPEGTPAQQPVKNNGRYIYILIDKEGYSFDKAINSTAWANYEEVPDKNGYGVALFIYKEELNKDLAK